MRIAIIGGGAAGLMAAATINENSPTTDVFLIEKNDSLGKKVIISGGGRCNVTTGITDIKTVLKKYPRGEKFLINAFHRFGPQDVYDWFEKHAVALKCEKDLRVFPKSDNGRDVVGAFERIFEKQHTKVLLKHNVKQIEKKDTQFIITCKDQIPLTVDRVVLALGGQAYRQTGSTGDGYTLAENLGHHITPLAPSLYSFITKEKWPKEISGMSFANITITAKGTKTFSFSGPALFTHTGLSGPAVFALSSLIAFEPFGPPKPLPIFVDLIPDIKSHIFLLRLKESLKENPKKSFKNILHFFIPQSLAEIICREIGVPVDKKAAEISNHEVAEAEHWIKHLPLHLTGRGAGDEFVTAGGVELAEVEQRTMESKLCPGLYFAGEILNVDGFTGGFNLQASWATGRVAGESINNGLS